MSSAATPFTKLQLDALASLRDAVEGSRWALIGASAIRCRLPLQRPTYDIDLAVAASSSEVSAALSSAGWTRHERMLQRWERDRVQVDIVQATDADIANSVADLGDGFELTVIGFDLAYVEVDPIEVRPKLFVPATRLHVIALLKMIAWLDRPAEREKDLKDIFFLWENALPEDDVFRYDPKHPVGAAGLEYDDHGAFYLGWLLGRVAQPVHGHWARRFLGAMRDDEGSSFARFVRAAGIPGDDREARMRTRLKAFEQGLDVGATHIPAVASSHLIHKSARRTAPTLDARAALLHDAIDQLRLVRFRADGHVRIVEPHVLGVHGGRTQLLALQIGGTSSSRALPGWRRFNVSDLSGLEILGEQFAGARPTGGEHSAFDRHVAIVRARRR